jgi:anti-sigma B factor antagonist
MPEVIRPVRWIGQLAVVTLPRRIDSSNAGHVREQLLLVANSGATVVIDMAATVSCDYSGAEAVARAYQRAVASGTNLRLVVAAEAVRRVFGVDGLHRLIPTYPTLDAALAAGRDVPGPRRAARTAAVTPVMPSPRPPAPDLDDGTAELLDRVVNDIFSAALNLQDAVDSLPHGAITQRVTDSVCHLDRAIREIRDHVFAGQSRASQPDPASWRLPDIYERAAAAATNTAFLRQRLVHRAHALHDAVADTAALLEQRADLVGEPSAIDYPADIKRWRIIADQAEEMAERWQQRSLRVPRSRNELRRTRARPGPPPGNWRLWHEMVIIDYLSATASYRDGLPAALLLPDSVSPWPRLWRSARSCSRRWRCRAR